MCFFHFSLSFFINIYKHWLTWFSVGLSVVTLIQLISVISTGKFLLNDLFVGNVSVMISAAVMA